MEERMQHNYISFKNNKKKENFFKYNVLYDNYK